MNNQTLGNKGEELAKTFLLEKGYELLEQNWRHKKSEVDLICRKDGVLIFVEVKTRSTDRFGYPEESVGFRKEEKLAQAAAEYIEQTNHQDEIRFDIVSIILGKETKTVAKRLDSFCALVFAARCHEVGQRQQGAALEL